MSANAVTARSRVGLRASNLRSAPKGRRVQALRLSRRALARAPTVPHAIVRTGLSRAALGRAALILTRTQLPLFAAVIAVQIFRRYVDPAGFPGFDNIGEAWRKPTIGHIYSPGQYVPNPFDFHDNPDNLPESLLDTDDVVGATIRYWGDFGADPYPNPVPGTNWPQVTNLMPVGLPGGSPGIKHKLLPDLAPQVQPLPRWTPAMAFAISISLGTVSENRMMRVRNNPPRKRDGEPKVKPANLFVWMVMKKLANAGGETKEYLDIFADATGYWKGSIFLPIELRNTGKETQAKWWWLFEGGGLRNLDWEELAVLIVENEIEDLIYGALGQLSKAAAQSLNLTVGPQTGLVM